MSMIAELCVEYVTSVRNVKLISKIAVSFLYSHQQ